MTRTTNYNLIVVEGSDKVNLLTQMNPNTEKIDEVMKANENSGIQIATELLSGTVHAITRTVPSASMFKFTAVSNYTAGDTFTVDGVQVTALLTSGEALGTGAYIIGSEVLCSLKDTLLTVYTQGGTVKLAEDSEKLGGNLPEYYAKQSDLLTVKSTADSASSLSRQNSDNINELNQKLATKIPNYASYDVLGTPTTNATYNINKDGFFQLHGATLAQSSTIFHRIRINNSIVDEGYTSDLRYGYFTSPLFPVLKGDVVAVEVDTSISGVNYESRLFNVR